MHYDGTAFGQYDKRTQQTLVTMVPLKVINIFAFKPFYNNKSYFVLNL